VAYTLAKQGVPLLLTGRNAAALKQTSATCAELGARAEIVCTHLDGPMLRKGVEALVACSEQLGGATSLIACAGAGWAGPAESTPYEVVEQLVDVNVAAPMLLTRALLPQMLAAGRGRIVFVGSIAGAVGVGGEAVYSGSKAALIGFADALRAEVARRGVTVTVALPGAVDTPFFDRRGIPYSRRRPVPRPADEVARRIVSTAAAGRAQAYIPGWLSFPAWLHAATPNVYRRLAARWG
jgi:short-subunit dehydrogenase